MASSSSPASVLIASNNQHKIQEIRAIFADTPIRVLAPQDFSEAVAQLDVKETGDTFAANAQLKAHAFGELTQQLVVADDSGLEVTLLHGEPGVQSKRWVVGSDADRNAALLQQMQSFTDRTARFITAACIHNPLTGTDKIVYGLVAGHIAHEPSGSAGFGYDPIFIPEGYNQTFAELGPEVKNQLSHRARAFEQVKRVLLHKQSL